jgi:hypothetical protein
MAQMENQAQSQALVDQSLMQLVSSMQANMMQEISKATLEYVLDQTSRESVYLLAAP